MSVTLFGSVPSSRVVPRTKKGETYDLEHAFSATEYGASTEVRTFSAIKHGASTELKTCSAMKHGASTGLKACSAIRHGAPACRKRKAAQGIGGTEG